MTCRNATRFAFAAALMVAAANLAVAGTVTFQDNFNGRVDVFLTPSAGAEFTNFDLIVTPEVGALLDPNRNQAGNAGDFDSVADGAREDTWANTPFSALGAGTPSFVFTSYHPGAPPFTQPQELPSAGGAISSLNWSVFDTNTGDNAANGPYHVARILYTAGGRGTLEVLAFDTITSGTGGESFSIQYGIPEPATFAMAGMGLIGLVALRRRSA